jgi:hypothetical protein
MSRPSLKTAGGIVLLALLPASPACNLVGPSCRDENGAVLDVTGQVAAGGMASYSVTSSRNSNLILRLTWPDTAATLAMRATITACGTHTGCSMISSVPSFGPGGSSPTPQPWPPGLREMQVDGSKGKSYHIEVAGDAARDATFTLTVRDSIVCER